MTKFLLLAILLLAFVPIVSAQPSADLVIEAHNDANDYWFQLQGQTERNPMLNLQPNTDYNITLVNLGTMPHNIRFDGTVGVVSGYTSPGNSTSIAFTTGPKVGPVSYWCDPHRAVGMEGVAQIETKSTPMIGALALVAIVGVAALACRKN